MGQMGEYASDKMHEGRRAYRGAWAFIRVTFSGT